MGARLSDQPDDDRPVDPDDDAVVVDRPGSLPDAERPVLADEPPVEEAPEEQEDG